MAYLELPDDPRVFKIKLPMRVKTSSKKKQALNLNVYRNLHHRSLHAQKTKFEKIAKKLLQGIPPLGVITLHYEVCPESKRRLDIMNVGSIVDKYFSDALTHEGIIEDDDYKHIPKVTFDFGGLHPEEHVLVTITEIEPRKENKPMRVLLDKFDVEKALTAYVSSLNIPNASGAHLKIEDGEITAEVMFKPIAEESYSPVNDIQPISVPIDETISEETPAEEKPKRRKRRTKAEMEAARETANVDETAATSPDLSDGGDTQKPQSETAPVTDTETVTEQPKATPKGNLFGDKETPSSEDDSSKEVTLDSAPEPVVTEEPKKRGSIFDT